VFKELRFGAAWIDLWTRVLDAGDPDTLLRYGVGVKGAVYRSWLERWKTDGRRTTPEEYLTANLAAIAYDADLSPRCPECGTEWEMHAAYCSRRLSPQRRVSAESGTPRADRASRATAAHRAVVERLQEGFQAQSRCGWQGEIRPDAGAAWLDRDVHRQQQERV
jgi:hypothetical protein